MATARLVAALLLVALPASAEWVRPPGAQPAWGRYGLIGLYRRASQWDAGPGCERRAGGGTRRVHAAWRAAGPGRRPGRAGSAVDHRGTDQCPRRPVLRTASPGCTVVGSQVQCPREEALPHPPLPPLCSCPRWRHGRWPHWQAGDAPPIHSHATTPLTPPGPVPVRRHTRPGWRGNASVVAISAHVAA